MSRLFIWKKAEETDSIKRKEKRGDKMGNLQEKRIAITGSRKMAEMSMMVQKKGGTAYERPLQETIKCKPEDMQETLNDIIANGTEWSIFTTGVGTTALFEAAASLGLTEPFQRAMAASRIATRGYKTVQELKKYGLVPEIVDGDGTNAGLLGALEGVDLAGQRVFLQLHGERVPALEQGFAQKGAELTCIMPYETTVPHPEIVTRLVHEVINGELDAVLLTATPQVRVLFKEAEKQGLAEELAQAFNEGAVAGSIGRVTTGTLNEYGVTRVIAPEHERMGALVVAVDEFFKGD